MCLDAILYTVMHLQCLLQSFELLPPSLPLSPDLDEMSDKASSEHGEEGEPGEQGSTKASSPGSGSSMPLPSMLLERKMETLIQEWHRSPDMLFTIHPSDGSFLVWHVKYLDEFIQGIFRQVQVSRTRTRPSPGLLTTSTCIPYCSVSANKGICTLRGYIHHNNLRTTGIL